MGEVKKLKYFSNGKFVDSATDKYMDIFNPSTGEVMAQTPCCTEAEVVKAVEAAHNAYPAWRNTPPAKRQQIFIKLRQLIEENEEELTDLIAREHGKVWKEAAGDLEKTKEPTEYASSIAHHLMGESLMDTSLGIDTVMNREALGVFAGIAPFNFPAMIPMGWMAPLAIATGNTFVLKASSTTPLTSYRFAELYQEAGLPDGVLNVLTCSRNEAEILLQHPSIKGVSFVGTTKVGLHVYATAAAHGKRVQSQTEAKNHGLVLEDAPIDRTAAAIISAAFGCAGERCMALPVVVVQESVADQLVAALIEQIKTLKIGPAYDKSSDLGPVVSEKHRNSVLAWIDKGLEEGAELVLDGRGIKVPGYQNGFYLGHTIFDHVTPEMSIGNQEIFGPVLCIKRAKDFEAGLSLINRSPFANGAAIFTQNGYYAREFAKRVDAGMVGVNVPIPVPYGVFPFSGHKNSFFGDLHCLGKDGVRFYTEIKSVTSRWFDEEEMKRTKLCGWGN
jgi:malonate-semialdehyde dehydrogenase (acetylating) / methylmalonate-semialdehyde dehydrogenase